MHTPGLLYGALALIVTTSTCFSQSTPEAGLCRDVLLIGEIRDAPFQADIVRESWKVGPDGVRDPASLSTRNAGYVARDSKGLVVLRIYEPPDAKAKPGNRDANGWSEMVCDPRAQTAFQVILPPHQSRGFVANAPKFTAAGRKGRDTTVIFSYWHNRVAGRENLGEEPFENVTGYRYRVTSASGVHEVVNADQLAVELLKSDVRPPAGQETRLTNLRLTEPPRKLLDIPAWAALQLNPLPQPMVPANIPGGIPQ